MLWIKAFHIVFVVTWFAGLFYLPRLFVYHAMATETAEKERLIVMERKLFIMMTIGGVLSLGLGVALLWWWIAHSSAYFNQGWLHVKLSLVATLVVYHFYCLKLMRQFKAGQNKYSHRWYRWFNEFPSLILIAVVILVVVKPF